MTKFIPWIILLVLVIAILALYQRSQHLQRAYRKEVQEALALLSSEADQFELLTEADLEHLPEQVQAYLRKAGVIGKPKVKSFRMVCTGEFKTAPDKGFVPSRAEQVNLVDDSRRVYFMGLEMSGLPVVGLHVYKNATATMQIRLAGLVTVADARGELMNKAETVTVLNDMCLIAPATLIDPRISWEPIDENRVRAIFTNQGITVSAELVFNDQHELVNFVSNDRYLTVSGQDYQSAPWSTPVSDYQDFGGIRLASVGEAHWQLPEGDYCYGRIRLESVAYNVTE
ncbi:MAG: hypothetical protein EOM70_09445 [Clostridia bacterium]|nr:hypothetical protein [Clostridia bacterium]